MVRFGCVVVALMAPLAALGAPTTFTFQGRLLDSLGAPTDEPTVLHVALFDTDTSTAFWETDLSLSPQDGYFTAILGDVGQPALDSAQLADGATWIQLFDSNEDPIGARTRLAAVPTAASVLEVSGVDVDAATLSIGGVPLADATGAVVRDLEVDGHVQNTGITFPYTGHISGMDWLDPDQVTIESGANAQLQSDGDLRTGANFSGGSFIMSIPVLPAGAVPAGRRVRVEVNLWMTCTISDCDNSMQLVDPSGSNGIAASPHDNDGGGFDVGSLGSNDGVDSSGMGRATLFYLDYEMGGTTSTLDWDIIGSSRRTQSWAGNVVHTPENGLQFRISRGDTTEGYDFRELEYTVTLLP